MDWDQQILNCLSADGGLATGTVANSVGPPFGHNKRTHSAFIRTRLLKLEKDGLVRRLDDLKPVCWCLSKGFMP